MLEEMVTTSKKEHLQTYHFYTRGGYRELNSRGRFPPAAEWTPTSWRVDIHSLQSTATILWAEI